MEINYTMLCDFYEITMANGYFRSDKRNELVVFDMFFRTIPDKGGFAIFSGIDEFINYIKNLRFSEKDIEYLRSRQFFNEDFLDYLENFKFTGSIYAMKEGTPIFPGEPIVTVVAKAIEAQFIETFLLLSVNHQSLIATKTNRIVRAAEHRGVMEFGSRRAHGPSAAILGARAAYIGGAVGSACAIADIMYKVPALGTMAHSWVLAYDSEYEAFKEYCKIYPNNATLLVDTYDTLKSGVPNAIKVFKELGITKCGIRLDSGDIAYLSKKAREMLDEAGLTECKITASNSLDEYIIRDLIYQGAKVDTFGVGERLITSASNPTFGGVYKLAAIIKDNQMIPRIKISENIEKVTNPGFKKVYRIFDKNGKAVADYIALSHEKPSLPLTLFSPTEPWKKCTYDESFCLVELLIPYVIDGEVVYQNSDVVSIRKFALEQVETLWDEVKRFENPHKYYVDLSQELFDLKQKLLNEHRVK